MNHPLVKVSLEPRVVHLLETVGKHWNEHPLTPASDNPLPGLIRKAVDLFLKECRRRDPELAQKLDAAEFSKQERTLATPDDRNRVVALARRRGRPRKASSVEGRSIG